MKQKFEKDKVNTIQQGDMLELEISSPGKNPKDGIAKINNFVIIVKGGKVGHKYQVEITRLEAKYGFAEVIKEL